MAIPLGQWRSHVFRAAGCRKPNKQGAVSYNGLFINQPYLQTEGVTARDVCVCVRAACCVFRNLSSTLLTALSSPPLSHYY